MQASQSSSAYEPLDPETKSEPKPESTFTRGLPSPFSAPIQAARKYLERQRGDAWQAKTEAMPQGAAKPCDEALARTRDDLGQDDRTPGTYEESIRERDRRLERSLYEGHSMEAGLNIEASDHGVAAAAERAYFADSDGPEPLFAYVASGPLPDPDVVRGAILRLARESELRREPVPVLRESLSPAARDAKLDEKSSGQDEASQPLNFGEVARRVWGVDDVQYLPRTTRLRNEAPAVAAEFIGSVDGELEEPRRSGLPTTSDLPVELERHGVTSGSAEGGRARLQSLAEQTASSGGRPSEAEPAAGFAPVKVVSDVEQESALAHDARNLLSALTLYSELLGSPGVLAEAYRHYAEELRLIAGRSQALIDRLLQVAATRKEQASHRNAGPVMEAGAVGQASGGDALDAVPAGPGETTGREAADLTRAPDPPVPSAQIMHSGQEGGTDAKRAETMESKMAVPSIEESAAFSQAEVVNALQSSIAANGAVEATSLEGLLMRWGSLLSTLAHGTLEIVFGPHADVPVPAGAEALERILVNLVRNARAATIEGGAIRIGVGLDVTGRPGKQEVAGGSTYRVADTPVGNGASRNDTMVLTVDDSGCGMTESQIRRILGEDTREDEAIGPLCVPAVEVVSEGYGRWPGIVPDSSRRRGLGLQIVRELVAASGGTLSIQSWPGRGTRIEIRWPVAFLGETSAEGAQASPVEESVDDASAVLYAVPPTSGGTPSRAIPEERVEESAGPDGFSETELRAMILRLHRAGPQERTPISKKIGSRPAGVDEGGRGFVKRETAAKGAIAC